MQNKTPITALYLSHNATVVSELNVPLLSELIVDRLIATFSTNFTSYGVVPVLFSC